MSLLFLDNFFAAGLPLPDQISPGSIGLNALPYSVRGVRDSFANLGLNNWLLWVLLLTPVLLTAVIILWYKIKSAPSSVPEEGDDPFGLFEELLGDLELTEADKKLLYDMAQGANLQHPATCLLSPGMLGRARQIWMDEKGKDEVTDEKYKDIDRIAVTLYGHEPE